MTVHTKQKLFAALKVAVLSLSLPLPFSSNIWAQASIYPLRFGRMSIGLPQLRLLWLKHPISV